MNELQQAAFELRLDDVERRLGAGDAIEGALLAACSAHDPDPDLQRRVIERLIDRGSDVGERDKNGVTPLHRAVRFRSVSAVTTLIALGADVNAVDRRSGSTPLHRAVTSTGAPSTAGKADDALEIAELLLAAGADPAATNKAGKTPLDYAKGDSMRTVLRSHGNAVS